MTDGFWPFSLRFYDDPATQAACLSVQDDHGGDVNVALCLLWHASRGQAVTRDDVDRLTAFSGPWKAEVVAPLREVRRRLKESALSPDPAAQEAFRTKVKAVELAAEKLQQSVLEGIAVSGAPMPADAAARHNLALYGAGLIPPLSETLMTALTARLRQLA